MKIKAAVLYETNTPLVVEDLELDEPKEGEVLIRMASGGICRSDYHVIRGEWTVPLPMVLGHEAAGVVERVGAGVTKSKPGDHVILNFRPNCGKCRFCTGGKPVLCSGSDTPRWMLFDGTVRLHKGGLDIHHFARVASQAEYAVVPESGAVPIRPDMPLDKACLIGCSVMTGIGAAINTAKVQPGSTVAVFGCGGVGLNVVQGARLAGAERIIAVDVLEHKLALARQFGATDIVDAAGPDVAGRIQDMTRGGVDYAFDAFGASSVIETAYSSTVPGGTTVLVGMAPETEQLTINALSIPRNERVIMGSYYGSANVWVDLPKMVDLYLEGRIDIDDLITAEYSLDKINDAFEALNRGDGSRGILRF